MLNRFFSSSPLLGEIGNILFGCDRHSTDVVTRVHFVLDIVIWVPNQTVLIRLQRANFLQSYPTGLHWVFVGTLLFGTTKGHQITKKRVLEL